MLVDRGTSYKGCEGRRFGGSTRIRQKFSKTPLVTLHPETCVALYKSEIFIALSPLQSGNFAYVDRQVTRNDHRKHLGSCSRQGPT